jgi:hemerythrin-like domain-containing protein
METMTMNRVIHGAVRRDLRRLEEALAAASPGDRARAQDLHRAFGFLRDQLVHHHHGEDEHVFPALQRLGVDTALLGDMEEEHEQMANALADADAALRRYAGSGSAEDLAQARHAVVGAREATERHLAHEEEQLEPLMLPHFESEEWKAAEKKLRSQPPGVAGRFFAWVEDGMGEPERAYYSSAVPAPVRFILGRVFGRAYHRDIAPVWRG